MTLPEQTTRRRKVGLVAAVIAVPCLVAGSVGVQAISTLESTVRNNTSTIHGATPGSVLPEAAVTVDGAPFAIAYSPHGEITGSTATPFVLTNEGDAVATWDAAMAATTDSDEVVAAATTITATVLVAAERQGVYLNGKYVDRRGTTEIELDLGTLAEPRSVMEAWQVWRGIGGQVQLSDEYGTWSPLRTSTFLAGLESDQLPPGETYTVTITPAYDEDLVAESVSGLEDGETAVATASFRVTSMTAAD